MGDNKMTIEDVLRQCMATWAERQIAPPTITEMRAELESHLRDAERNGKSPEAVIGPDVDRFARTWADAQVPGAAGSQRAPLQRGARAGNGRMNKSRVKVRVVAWLIIIITVIAFRSGSRIEASEAAPWQWIFVGAAFLLLVGEIFTGGFFVLPFAIGAGVAALLSFANIAPTVTVPVFVAVSALALWGLREFAAMDDDVFQPVGASRYVGRRGVVTEPINAVAGVGRVRLGTEDWVAMTDGSEWIETDSIVQVVEVRGIRLVVEAAI